MKPFLILQLRPNDQAAQGEFDAFLQYGGLAPDEVVRVRMELDALPKVDVRDYAAVIVGGGPWNVSDAEEKKSAEQRRGEAWLRQVLNQVVEHDHPYFGACYGFGALVKHVGGTVSQERYDEPVSAIDVTLTDDGKNDSLLSGFEPTFRAIVGHKEACQDLPEGMTWLASGESCPYQMVRVKQHIYATQFHPELDQKGIATRIDVYRHAGYFPPESAEELKASFSKETLTVPMEILKRFVERYRLATTTPETKQELQKEV